MIFQQKILPAVGHPGAQRPPSVPTPSALTSVAHIFPCGPMEKHPSYTLPLAGCLNGNMQGTPETVTQPITKSYCYNYHEIWSGGFNTPYWN